LALGCALLLALLMGHRPARAIGTQAPTQAAALLAPGAFR
jgi:hypothetical protein